MSIEEKRKFCHLGKSKLKLTECSNLAKMSVMTKSNSAVFFLSLLFFVTAVPGVVSAKPSDRIQREGCVFNGRILGNHSASLKAPGKYIAKVPEGFSGLVRCFDSRQGRLLEEFQVESGQLNGTSTKYDSKGQIYEITNFRNNKMHGQRQSFDSSGKLQMLQSYVDGQMSGLQKMFHPNGQMSRLFWRQPGLSSQEYSDIQFNPKGQIISLRCGNSPITHMDAKWCGFQGPSKVQIYTSDGKPTQVMSFSAEGKKIDSNRYSIKFQAGILVEEIRKHPSGKISSELRQVSGVNYSYKQYDEFGKLILSGQKKRLGDSETAAFELDGAIQRFLANGKLFAEERFEAGLREGLQKYYVDGRLDVEDTYAKGRLVKTRYFDSKGQVERQFELLEGQVKKWSESI